ncbi:MAG: glycosyltransferase [Pseudomonadota bacterium]
MGRKIKVLRIIGRLNIGGPAIHTVLLTDGLDKTKFDSILLTGSVGEHEGDMHYFAEERGVKPIIIPEMGRDISWKNDLRAFWKISKIIKREKPDFVHTHTAKAGTIGREAAIVIRCRESLVRSLKRLLFYKKSRLAAHDPQVKIVHTFHGHIFRGYFHPLKTRAFLLIERVLARFTDKIIVLSNQQFKELCYHYKIAPPEKFAIIPLGLEIDKFLQCETKRGQLRKELGIPREIPIVGIVGRLVPVKNHRMFLDTVAEVIKTKSWSSSKNAVTGCQAPVARFIVVGDGELRGELETYSKQLGIQDDVIFTGWREDLDVIYADLDIVALTSLNEGTPVSLIEAMAAGKPVVATDTGGVRDLVTSSQQSAIRQEIEDKKASDGIHSPGYKIYERGILVQLGDVHGFAEAVRVMLNDGELRKKMGNEGRKLAQEKYRKERLYRDIEDLYLKL